MAKLVRIVSVIGNVERYVSETIANNPIRLKQLGFIKADIDPIEIEPQREFPVVDLAKLNDTELTVDEDKGLDIDHVTIDEAASILADDPVIEDLVLNVSYNPHDETQVDAVVEPKKMEYKPKPTKKPKTTKK